MTKNALVLAACLLPIAAFAQAAASAQGAAGVATRVEGLVTISQGQSVGLLQPGTDILDGARVVTGSSGSTVLRVGANCEVQLGPNQSVLISAQKACGEIIASVQNIGAPGTGTQVASNTILGMNPTVAMAAGAAGLVGLVARAGRDAPVSGQ